MAELAIAWFRRDLRLDDNPAWADACGSAATVAPLYVIDPRLFDAAGHHRRAALLAHLDALDARLQRLGGRLRVERDRPDVVVARVAAELGARSLHLNADTTPFATARDEAVRRAVPDVEWRPHWGTLVHPPGSVLTAAGEVPQVFTAFWKRWDATAADPWPASGVAAAVRDETGAGIPDGERPPEGGPRFGEDAAGERLDRFGDRVDDYPTGRDLLAEDATSHLSIDLRWGAISPRRIAFGLGMPTEGRRAFVRQLAWRDWYAHLLAVRPGLRTAPMRAGPELAWLDDPEGFAAWRDGATGYPVVDAGMRQLAATGWMHNRARMITASFLVKDLLIDWRRGERWFFDQLADGDVSQNVGNWQWVAGTGPDAAPYFRVFNPVTQGRRFDPDGEYVRRWVPELAAVPTRWIHAPWEAPPLELAAASVVLGADYPAPVVDHAWARERALAAYRATR